MRSEYKISEERAWDIRDEVTPILEAHWREIGRHRDKIRLAVDWGQYKRLTELDICVTVTVRHQGRLIGYVVNFVSPSLHYCHDIFAVNDVIYLSREKRHQGAANEMMDFCERLLKEKYHVRIMHIHMKHAYDFSGWMRQRGYEAIETNWEKML